MSITKDFYLFGSPIVNSKSPEIHHKFFLEKGLSYHYSLYETEEAQSIVSTNYLGASVTIPLKEKVIPFIDELSKDVEMLGAVNTITKRKDGTLKGDNTDWLAIRDVIQENYQQGKGLVIGTGGTALAAAYSLSNLDITYDIFGRNVERCREIKNKFGTDKIVTEYDKIKYGIIIICIPPSVKLDFSKIQNCIIIEMAYTSQPERNYGKNKVITGESLLYRQAVYQHQIWMKSLEKN